MLGNTLFISRDKTPNKYGIYGISLYNKHVFWVFF